MDMEFNISYITLSGYVEINTYRYLYFTVFFTVYVLIICSNSTIVYIIWTDKNLHEPMYIFIAALLFNCVLYSSTVYPKLLIDMLSESPIISYSACLFQFFAFYSAGATEFLLLAAMAFDRYVSICKPLRYPTIMRTRTVNVFLILAWVLPAVHLSFTTSENAKAKICSFTLKGIFCNNSVFFLHCVKSTALVIFGFISLIDLVILPLVFTVFTYTMILLVSFGKGKTVRRKAAETCIPHLLVLINFSYLAAYDTAVDPMESSFSQTVQLIMTLQLFLYHPWLNPVIYGLKMKEIYKRLKTPSLTRV